MSEPEADRQGFVEFIAIMAMLIAMVAMSIDAILPALAPMGEELGVSAENDRQLAVSLFFLGLAVSQFAFGPVSDSFGRRRSIFLGLGIYLAGTVLCLMAQSWWVLIAGRIIQGIGAAGPRIVANAIIRDRFSGRMMARVTSFVMTVFILVPVFAPLIGQGFMLLGGWRAIIWFLGGFGLLALIWVALRLPETLPHEKRAPFRVGPILLSMREVFGNRVAMCCTLAMGCVFSSFLAFLSSSQQVLGEAYGLGVWFPLTFSALASVVGLSSALNSFLVMRFGMHRLSVIGIVGIGLASLCYALWFLAIGTPPLWAALVWLTIAVGAIGIVFGNLNAMAMDPLGHVAGVAAGTVASIASLISVVFGTMIARSYDGTALPVALGFAACAAASLLFLHLARRDRDGATA